MAKGRRGHRPNRSPLPQAERTRSITTTADGRRAMEAFRGAVEKIMGRATDDQQLDCALMASVQKQLTEVADAVAAVRPLAELPEPEKRECAKTSAVKRYAATSVVYGNVVRTSLILYRGSV